MRKQMLVAALLFIASSMTLAADWTIGGWITKVTLDDVVYPNTAIVELDGDYSSQCAVIRLEDLDQQYSKMIYSSMVTAQTSQLAVEVFVTDVQNNLTCVVSAFAITEILY